MQQRAPQFLVLEDRTYRSFRAALAALWETEPPAQSIGLYHSRAWPRDHHPVPGLFTSLLLHFSLVLVLVRVPFFLLQAVPKQQAEEHHAHQIVYVLRPLNLSDYFPAVRPKGLGGKPGQGSLPAHPPARGGAACHSQLTIISNPPRPDNKRQTIVQLSSPPELKIPKDLRLPDVLIGGTLPEPPKPAPAATPPRHASEVPVMPRIQSTPSMPAAPTLALTAPPNPLPNPLLPMSPPPPPPAAPPESSKTTEASAIADLGLPVGASRASGLLSLSVEPAPATESVALPPGNRLGAFSVSPAGGKEGSPGGIAGGDARGGSGGSVTSGDASAGIGPGREGGGGGRSATLNEGVSINGRGESETGVLPSLFASGLVYPVKPPGPRRAAMVVTAGPAGGGGLQVYGLLKGGKIYTIYLPMPGRNWVLQYCAADDPPSSHPARSAQGIEIRLDPGVVPPSAEEQFDFHRPAFWKSTPNGKDMIILRGIIREDGSVGELRVLQGLLAAVDQAALAAFSRWKFRPALRSGKPIAVQVLVGIPLILSAMHQ